MAPRRHCTRYRRNPPQAPFASSVDTAPPHATIARRPSATLASPAPTSTRNVWLTVMMNLLPWPLTAQTVTGGLVPTFPARFASAAVGAVLGREDLEAAGLLLRRQGAKVRPHPRLLVRGVDVGPAVDYVPEAVWRNGRIVGAAVGDCPVDECLGQLIVAEAPRLLRRMGDVIENGHAEQHPVGPHPVAVGARGGLAGEDVHDLRGHRARRVVAPVVRAVEPRRVE